MEFDNDGRPTAQCQNCITTVIVTRRITEPKPIQNKILRCSLAALRSSTLRPNRNAFSLSAKSKPLQTAILHQSRHVPAADSLMD
jgi:hypothetical protein